MNRRDFLALLASAPIAALAPLPKILEQHRYVGFVTRTDLAPAPINPYDTQSGIALRYLKEWDIDPRQSVIRIDRFS